MLKKFFYKYKGNWSCPLRTCRLTDQICFSYFCRYSSDHKVSVTMLSTPFGDHVFDESNLF